MVATEFSARLAESKSTHGVIETGYSHTKDKVKTKYVKSELRLIETMDGICDRILEYKIHKVLVLSGFSKLCLSLGLATPGKFNLDKVFAIAIIVFLPLTCQYRRGRTPPGLPKGRARHSPRWRAWWPRG